MPLNAHHSTQNSTHSNRPLPTTHSSLVLLGSTGSIGVNTLIIAKRYNLEIEALVAGNNIDLLNEQIAAFAPKMVAIAREEDRPRVRHDNIFVGEAGILELLERSVSPTIVNALVGYAGMRPTLKAIELGRHVALANKESLVVAGEFIDTSRITPIDSEHFGLWYLLNDRPVDRLVITASGGAFRDWDIDKIADATFAQALNHPNWSMGNKITIDSATMTNKLFELLEAKWLFGIDRVDAVLEKKSIIHALVEFVDGSTTAHFAGVDMKLPIAFALFGHVDEPILPPTDLLGIGALEFLPIDPRRYPIWQIKDHILQNPHLGGVVNAANEAAITQFEQGKVTFSGMADTVMGAVKQFEDIHAKSIDEIIAIDKEVRAYAIQRP
jgi:1-deoxy-D-xylulose-5-phosphate reductoisomerase